MNRLNNLVLCFSLLLLCMGLLTCGTKDAKEIKFSLKFSADYDERTVTDVIYYLVNITDQSKLPLVYPRECPDRQLESGCGFAPGDTANLVLCFDSECNGANPTDYPISQNTTVQLLYCARAADTTVIYKGISPEFTNNPVNQTVTLTIPVESVPNLVDCRED